MTECDVCGGIDADCANCELITPPHESEINMSTTSFIIQQANTETGEYDVMKPRPYPITVQAEGFKVDDLARRMYDADHLIGFQDTADKQVVTLYADDFAREPELAVGKFPVFVGADGRFFGLSLPVQSVTPVKLIN